MIQNNAYRGNSSCISYHGPVKYTPTSIQGFQRVLIPICIEMTLAWVWKAKQTPGNTKSRFQAILSLKTRNTTASPKAPEAKSCPNSGLVGKNHNWNGKGAGGREASAVGGHASSPPAPRTARCQLRLCRCPSQPREVIRSRSYGAKSHFGSPSLRAQPQPCRAHFKQFPMTTTLRGGSEGCSVRAGGTEVGRDQSRSEGTLEIIWLEPRRKAEPASQ